MLILRSIFDGKGSSIKDVRNNTIKIDPFPLPAFVRIGPYPSPSVWSSFTDDPSISHPPSRRDPWRTKWSLTPLLENLKSHGNEEWSGKSWGDVCFSLLQSRLLIVDVGIQGFNKLVLFVGNDTFSNSMKSHVVFLIKCYLLFYIFLRVIFTSLPFRDQWIVCYPQYC